MSLYAPKTPPFDGGPATGQSLAGLAGLDARARDIFRRIVESYLETGEPVGSRIENRRSRTDHRNSTGSGLPPRAGRRRSMS